MLELENAGHPMPDRRLEIGSWRNRASVTIGADLEISQRAEELVALGLGPLDAAHLACAEVGGCHRFLSCDDRLIRRARRAGIEMVLNPTEYLEIEDG